MESASILANQIIVMFLLMAFGVLMEKKKMFSPITVKELNNLVVTIVTMCAIINAYQLEFSKQYVLNLFYGLILAIVAHIVGITVSKLIFRKKDLTSRLSIFGSVYSNSSFMALPLLTAVFGTEGIFYGAAYIGIFNIFLWSHGINLYREHPITSPKVMMIVISKNPVAISVVVGILLYVTNIRFPAQITSVIWYIASLNTPVAMILLGFFIAKCNILDAFKNIRIYGIVFLRLIFIPLIVLLLLKIATLFIDLDQTLMLAGLISTGCPTAATMAMFSERFDIDPSFGVKTVTVCTIMSLFTIPLLIMFAQMIL